MRSLLLAVLVALTACDDGSHLHAQDITAYGQLYVPEVMIALDVSEAMAPRLPELTSTLAQLVGSAPDFTWGLTEFPSAARPTCANEAVDATVPTARAEPGTLGSQAQKVAAALEESITARGDRNAAEAVHEAAFADRLQEHFTMLITSGDDACGADLVSEVRARSLDNVRTIIISYGPSTPALNDAASAGGFARLCPTGNECGDGETCELGVCSNAAYVARDPAELTAVFHEIATPGAITFVSTCDFPLAVIPASEKRVTVYVDGDDTLPGPDTWALNNGGGLHLQGAVCVRAQRAPVTAPLAIAVVVDDRPWP